MARFLRENSGPVFFSVLLHGGIVAALVLMAVMPSSHPPVALQSVPVNATVVDSRILHAAQQAKADRAAEQAAEARAAAEAQAAAQKAATQAQAEQQAKALEEQTKLAEQAKAEARAAEGARVAVNAAKEAEQAKAAQAKQAADARAAAEYKAAAESKAAAEAKSAADAKAAAKAAADAKAAAAAKAAADELRKELGDEEHVSAVEASPLKDRYVASLRNKIQNAWIKGPSARVGVDCLVEVTQVPGGEVTSAKVTQCNGDAALRQSIENAVYRASPLPDPPDPALFQRNFAFRFKPDE
ncbi:MAG: cell envelope integrity protein TolA [Steroidobacteraceae bacterium]|jgi:colicin import membrane protein